MTAKSYLFVALGGFTLFFLWAYARALRARPAGIAARPTLATSATGFVTAFFDTLGIGSFATTTSLFRHFRLVDDAVIPGTLNVGITLPTVVQAYIYTRLIPVGSVTLILMIA